MKFLYDKLKLKNHEKTKGRKLSISATDTITLSLYKQVMGITTKLRLFDMFKLPCTYKTLVVNMNRFSRFAMVILVILTLVMKSNRKEAHLIKHIDSTDIPVCLNKNAKKHKTMAALANWGVTGKGSFYGLKLHLVSDLKKKILSLCFTSGNVDDRKVVIKLNKGLYGIFIANAGYISKELQREFYEEHKRILFAKPRKNIGKLMTSWQSSLYKTRMLIELNFRSLKMFHGLVTSLPRSVIGYLANYTYSLLAYVLA